MAVDFKSLSTYLQINYILANFEGIFSLVSVAGNLTTAYMFSRSNLRKFSFSFYIIFLAINDSFVMITGLTNWMKHVLGTDIELISTLLCVFSQYRIWTTSNISILFITLISLDRLLTVMYLNKFVIFKTRCFQLLLIVAIILCFDGILIIVPINSQLIEQDIHNSSQLVCKLEPEIFRLTTWISIGNLFIFAFLINNVICLKLVQFIWTSRRIIHRISIINNYKNKDRKLAICSISLNLICTISKIPLLVSYVINYTSILTRDQVILVETVFEMCSLAQYGSVFLVNFIANSMFREELLHMVGFKKRTKVVSSTASINL